jgi:hypothetical protein
MRTVGHLSVVRPLAVALLAALLPLAACQGTGAGPEADGSPLAEYRDLALGTRQEQEDLNAAQATQYEDVVARCMSDAGFDYSPQDRRPVSSFDGDADPSVDPGSRGYREQHGYGITESILKPSAEETSPDTSADDGVDDYPPGLSEQGREAYDLQLFGESVADDSGTFRNVGGCHNEAWDSVYGASTAPDEQWQQLVADLESVHDVAMSSPEAVAVAEDWSRCMSDLDVVGLADPSAAEQTIRSLVDGAVSPDESGLMIADTARLAEIEQIESRLSLLDLDCQEKVDYVERREAILWAHEQDFVDDRRAELEAWALAEADRRG